jgi:hypothetical protein
VRSLWPNTGALENTLSKLQKVCDELVTNSGHRSGGPARALSAHEAAVREVKLCLVKDRPNSNSFGKG